MYNYLNNIIMEKIDWKKNYAEGWQIFDAILANSGWGKGKVGGPVWLMNVRYENVALLLPDHPWLSLLQQNDNNCHCWLNARFQFFIEHYGLGNVLLLIGTETLFWSSVEFVQMIVGTCGGGIVFYPKESDTPSTYTHFYNSRGFEEIPAGYPYLCVGNSGMIREDIYYYPLLHSSAKVEPFQKVRVVEGIENYLPMLVYDLMESISLSVNGDKMRIIYPKMQYRFPDKLWHYDGREIPLNGIGLNLKDRRWHYCFPLRVNWEVYNGS